MNIKLYDDIDNYESLELAINNASTSLTGYPQELDGYLEIIDNEIKRLKNIKEKIKDKKENYIQALKEIMENKEITKIQTPTRSITLVKNPISVEIYDESQVPIEYTRTKIEIDKRKILENFMETREIIPGTKIIDNKKSIRIK